MSKTHWRQLVNMDYLGSYALPEGNDLTLTIAKVSKELVVGASGRKEQCMVCYWKEQNYKPMILNRTNAKTITNLCGSAYVEDWVGHRVTLYASTTRFGGDIVECLRIRPTEAAAPTQTETIFCEECGQEIKSAYNRTPAQIAESTFKKYGKKLCADCATKASQKE